jgi:hypothetical protein
MKIPLNVKDLESFLKIKSLGLLNLWSIKSLKIIIVYLCEGCYATWKSNIYDMFTGSNEIVTPKLIQNIPLHDSIWFTIFFQ